MLREKVEALVQTAWSRPPEEGPWFALFLAPLSAGYGSIQRLRRALYRCGLFPQKKLPCRVVSVGALRVGGSGKTPFALWLAGRLAEKGWRPAILTRGYRRRSSRGTQVLLHDRIESWDPLETGDEPYLLAKSLPGVPVVVDPNRYRGARTALARHPVDVFVLDDGFQHLRLARDLDIVLLDNDMGELEASCLPGGPLREPPQALQWAQVLVCFSGGGPDQGRGLRQTQGRRASSSPALVLHAGIRPVGLFTLDGRGPLDISHLRGEKVFAFCGIGRPASFWRTLERMEIEVAQRESFPDHHRYGQEDFERILGRLEAFRWAVTTEKDAVKITRFPFPPERVLSLRVTVQMDEEDRFWQVLFNKLDRNLAKDKSEDP